MRQQQQQQHARHGQQELLLHAQLRHRPPSAAAAPRCRSSTARCRTPNAISSSSGSGSSSSSTTTTSSSSSSSSRASSSSTSASSSTSWRCSASASASAGRPRRRVVAHAAKLPPVPTGSIYAALTPSLGPKLAFVAETVVEGVLVPVLGGFLITWVVRKLAHRARKWCMENPDEPLSLEMLGLLPAALDKPTRLAVLLFVTTRVVRNIAAGVLNFQRLFKAHLDSAVGAAISSTINHIEPLDATLLRVWSVVAVAASAHVLIKWKSSMLEFVLRQRADVAAARHAPLEWAEPGDAPDGAAPGAVLPAASDAPDEAGAVRRVGSMLAASMRPRRLEVAAAAAASAAAGNAAAAVATADGDGAVSGAGSAGSVSRARGLLLQGGDDPQSDDMERLLLPLDSVLSWAIAVMAFLLAVHTLGINIQPFLAIGGASSIIIGLATQTLLTNAVMGLSIFISRPFVPGDAIAVQAPGAIFISGVVEKVTPMRTLMRTDDDVLVALPNKTVADMIVFNKSRRDTTRSRLAARSWERPQLRFKVKLPHKSLAELQPLQAELRQALRRPGVSQQSIEVALVKFTEQGAEILLQCLLLVPVGSSTAQQLFVDLAATTSAKGATLTTVV